MIKNIAEISGFIINEVISHTASLFGLSKAFTACLGVLFGSLGIVVYFLLFVLLIKYKEIAEVI